MTANRQTDNLGDRMFRALRAADPTAPQGPWFMLTGGTVNIIGGGAGGTSQVDNNPFIPSSSSITPAGGYFGGRQVASGNAGALAISGSAILQVHVVAGGAGGGVANITVHGTAGNDVNVGVASGAAGAAGNWALPVVYASGMYATVNVGALPVHGVTALPGSMHVYGTINVRAVPDFTVWLANAAAGSGFATAAVYGSPAFPVYVLGTIGVNPLAVFTVNLGLGTVNVGNYPGVQVVDTRGSLVPTQWIISGAASGQFVVAGSAPANLRNYITSIQLISDGTISFRWMSPSGVAMTGSMRLIPGAGFGLAGAIPNGPLLIGSQQSPIFIDSQGTQNIGGIAIGYVGA